MALRALVVGGTGGIGHAIACRLAAEASASVIISGRTKPQTMPYTNMEFKPLDATSMRGIKQYTDALKSSSPGQELDLLVMTQGVMTMAGRTETPEGIDMKMALHYYGKQLLIRELLPVLKQDATVLVVFDGVYGNPAKLNWEDLDLKKHFSLGTAANHCMVMNDAMVQFHASEQQHNGTARRHFIHAWPGGVKSNLDRGLPWYVRPLLWTVGSLIAVSPETCATNLLNGASARKAEGEKDGRFWSNIDNKGRLVPDKKVWAEDEMKRISQHTWDLVDRAINASQ